MTARAGKLKSIMNDMLQPYFARSMLAKRAL